MHEHQGLNFHSQQQTIINIHEQQHTIISNIIISILIINNYYSWTNQLNTHHQQLHSIPLTTTWFQFSLSTTYSNFKIIINNYQAILLINNNSIINNFILSINSIKDSREIPESKWRTKMKHGDGGSVVVVLVVSGGRELAKITIRSWRRESVRRGLVRTEGRSPKLGEAGIRGRVAVFGRE